VSFDPGESCRAGLVLNLIRILFSRSAFWVPSQFRSSYFSEWEHIALRLVSESYSVTLLVEACNALVAYQRKSFQRRQIGLWSSSCGSNRERKVVIDLLVS